jgi:hypothetical protein
MDWHFCGKNERALRFYGKAGTAKMETWDILRVEEEGMQRLRAQGAGAGLEEVREDPTPGIHITLSTSSSQLTFRCVWSARLRRLWRLAVEATARSPSPLHAPNEPDFGPHACMTVDLINVGLAAR